MSFNIFLKGLPKPCFSDRVFTYLNFPKDKDTKTNKIYAKRNIVLISLNIIKNSSLRFRRQRHHHFLQTKTLSLIKDCLLCRSDYKENMKYVTQTKMQTKD